MRSFCAVLVLLAAGVPAEGNDADAALAKQAETEKRIGVFLQDIDSLAASEPAALAIDTRIRTAKALSGSRPAEAIQLLRDAQSGLTGVQDARGAGFLSRAIVDALLELDPGEAENFAASLPSHTPQMGPDDFKALAFEDIVRYWVNRDRKRARDAIRRGFASGTVRNRLAGAMLRTLKDDDPNEARGLFGEMLEAFRPEAADWRDVQFVLEAARLMRDLDRPLVFQAIDKILAALESEKFGGEERGGIRAVVKDGDKEVTIDRNRDIALVQLMGFTHDLGEGAYEQYRTRFERLKQDLGESGDLTSAANVTLRRVGMPGPGEGNAGFEDTFASPPVPDLSRYPLAEALSRARSEKDPVRRAWMLLRAAQRGGTAPDAKARIGAEVLQDGAGMKVGRLRIEVALRLIGLADGARDNALAASAANLLALTSAEYCKCEDDECASSPGRLSCLSLYPTIVSQLNRTGAEMEKFTFPDPSIQSRLLLERLRKLLPAARPGVAVASR